jgi:hypothetical protein
VKVVTHTPVLNGACLSVIQQAAPEGRLGRQVWLVPSGGMGLSGQSPPGTSILRERDGGPAVVVGIQVLAPGEVAVAPAQDVDRSPEDPAIGTVVQRRVEVAETHLAGVVAGLLETTGGSPRQGQVVAPADSGGIGEVARFGVIMGPPCAASSAAVVPGTIARPGHDLGGARPRPMAREASVDTSKPASCGHLKTASWASGQG